MLPEAIAAMTEELAELGNPSSLHNAGRRVRRVVEESREQIATLAPSRRNPSAQARPIPFEPPVMATIFPSSAKSIGSPRNRLSM